MFAQFISTVLLLGSGVSVMTADESIDCGWSTGCSMEISEDGSSVALGGGWTQPGQSTTNEGSPGAADAGAAAAGQATAASASTEPYELSEEERAEQYSLRTGLLMRCAVAPIPSCDPDPATDLAPVSPPVSIPAVTERDFTTIRPAAGELVLEPDGAGLIRRHFNVVVAAEEHTRQGELLGFPVTVRFSPVNYTFDYGDGFVLESDTGGITQASENAPQFTKGPTSHVYAERGEYTITVTTHYAAAVDFGDGIWRDVDGLIDATASADVRMYEAHTVLVAENCIDNPNGTGC